MPVRNVGLRGKDSIPVLLDVIQDERNELPLRLFLLIQRVVRRTVGRTVPRWRFRCTWRSGEELEEIGVEEKAEHQKQQRAAYPEVDAAKTATAEPKSSATASAPITAAFVTTIFDIIAGSAGSPFHNVSSEQLLCQ